MSKISGKEQKNKTRLGIATVEIIEQKHTWTRDNPCPCMLQFLDKIYCHYLLLVK